MSALLPALMGPCCPPLPQISWDACLAFVLLDVHLSLFQGVETHELVGLGGETWGMPSTPSARPAGSLNAGTFAPQQDSSVLARLLGISAAGQSAGLGSSGIGMDVGRRQQQPRTLSVQRPCRWAGPCLLCRCVITCVRVVARLSLPLTGLPLAALCAHARVSPTRKPPYGRPRGRS